MGGLPGRSAEGIRDKSLPLAPDQARRGLHSGAGAGKGLGRLSSEKNYFYVDYQVFFVVLHAVTSINTFFVPFLSGYFGRPF